MPDFSLVAEEDLGICVYETTSEGTPISPVFPNTPHGRFMLAKYYTEHATVFAEQKTGFYNWCQILFGGELVVVDYEKGTVSVPKPVLS
jgi:hypothetical protein